VMLRTCYYGATVCENGRSPFSELREGRSVDLLSFLLGRDNLSDGGGVKVTCLRMVHHDRGCRLFRHNLEGFGQCDADAIARIE